MTYRLIYSTKADAEFREAYNYYEEQVIGLGERFESCVDKKIAAIIRNPYAYASRRTDLRECWAKEFPFLIVYKISEKSKLITIASVFHTSHNPAKKYRQ